MCWAGCVNDSGGDGGGGGDAGFRSRSVSIPTPGSGAALAHEDEEGVGVEEPTKSEENGAETDPDDDDMYADDDILNDSGYMGYGPAAEECVNESQHDMTAPVSPGATSQDSMPAELLAGILHTARD